MGIDRKAFFALAMGIWAGPTACFVQPAPKTSTPTTKDNTTGGAPVENTTDPNMNATGECVQWDANNNCTTYEPYVEEGGYGPAYEAGYAPAGECTSWNAAGECNYWEPYNEGGYYPADECVSWNATGECVQWAPYNEGGYYPADECVDWNASGECINYVPAGERY